MFDNSSACTLAIIHACNCDTRFVDAGRGRSDDVADRLASGVIDQGFEFLLTCTEKSE